MQRRLLILASALFAAATVHMPAAAQGGYPTKPVTLLVGYPAGGPVDTLARAIGEKLSASMGQTVVVENVPGATGMIANQRLAKSAPDGYTLMLGANPMAIQASIKKSLPYNSLRDFTPIAYVGDAPYLLVVPANSPAKTVQELVSLVRASPGKMSYGSAGAGSANHLSGEIMKKAAGLNINHIPYKGGAPAQVDVMGGHVAYIFDAFITGVKLAQGGKLRALAVTTDTRSPAAPDVPTMAESGFPGFSVQAWYGLMGPGNMPAPLVRRLNEEVNKAIALPDMQTRLASMGLQARPGTAGDFAAFFAKDIATYATVIKDAGVPLED
ncbi:Bug family tripartite tricarboxylate transporter substrate binding protein [Ramlibacter sp.]|uniref:Bug family tripartite tricarboxylate transporter substrate binding protein n=1 Tax=Ramlibacter sp. TaxID=1917967 RepID=UPI003D0B6D87